MENQKKNYGLFTTITMIIGICIGSGIFFKSDNILTATGGSVLLGVIVFILGAVSIVFGGLCMSELASRPTVPAESLPMSKNSPMKNLPAVWVGFRFLYTILPLLLWYPG